jgi:hypothetical protein
MTLDVARNMTMWVAKRLDLSFKLNGALIIYIARFHH